MSKELPQRPHNKPDDWDSSFFKQEDMGRRYKNSEIITGAFARTLIEKAGLLEPGQEPLAILDNACGTGVVTNALHALLDEGTKERMDLVCGDFSEPMLETLSKRIADNGWERTKARMVDAQKTMLPKARFTHVLTNFAVMGLPDPTAALNGITIAPGGICAFTTWAHVDWIADVRGAFATIPGHPPFPDDIVMYRSWGQGDWHSPDWIFDHLSCPQKNQIYDFVDIDVEAVGKDLVMDSPAMFVDTFSVMIPVILKRFWTEQQRRELGDMVIPALLRYMEERYGKDKPVRMRWVANVVTARKPEDEELVVGIATKAHQVPGRAL
ncbi:MAG: hypothetical protein LQ350_003537 [Teloschistes chrysophthalmus]|nr:MAG: hypothetical protein LQ350_003537 [Niorma chrysophthalma]